MGRAASARRPRWGAARHAVAAARRRRAGAAPAPPLYQRLSSARRRLPGGSCPWGAGRTAWTHEQRRSGAKQAAFVATPAFMGKTRPKSALHLKPPLSPALDALPFLIRGLRRRSRTKPWTNEQLGGSSTRGRAAGGSFFARLPQSTHSAWAAQRLDARRQADSEQVDHGPGHRQGPHP